MYQHVGQTVSQYISALLAVCWCTEGLGEQRADCAVGRDPLPRRWWTE